MVPRAVAALAVAAAASVAAAWLTGAWPVVLAAAVAMAALAAGVMKGLSVVSHRSAQLAVMSGTLATVLVPPKRVWPHVPARAALPAPARMIEGRPVVTATVLSSYQEVMK
jgi:hypothetical protein